MMSFGRFPLWLMLVGSLLVALGSYRFIFLGFETAFGGGDVIPALMLDQQALFVAHVVASPIALLLGALQFFKGIRNRWPALHRWSGRIFALSVLIGGLASLGLSISSISDRPISSLGFGLLAVLWLASTALGVRAALQRDFTAHRTWLIYAFALTFSAVTLRVHLALGAFMLFSYDDIYMILAWSCWVPNLVFAWLYLKATSQPDSLPERTMSAPSASNVPTFSTQRTG